MEMNSPAPPCTRDHICWGAHAIHPDRHRLEVQAAELLSRFIDWTLQKQRYSTTLDYARQTLDTLRAHGIHDRRLGALLALADDPDA